MKLITKKLVMDEQTFTPHLELTVQLPMEKIMDDRAVDSNFYENFGRQFFDMLGEKRD